MKMKIPNIPLNLCDTCSVISMLKYEELAKTCENCKGDHPHINGTALDNFQKIVVECPYCGNMHIHDEPGVYTCGDLLYTVQPQKVIAVINSDYISIECPFCNTEEFCDTLPSPSIYFPTCCTQGLIQIVDTVENIYHSTKRIATNRLASI